MILETYKSTRVVIPALPWKGQQQQQQPTTKLNPTAAAVQEQQAGYPSSTTPGRPHLVDKEKAAKIGITPEEYVRRDNIVRNMWVENPFKVGDTVDCYDAKDREKYGHITVKQIFTNYAMFPLPEAKDWPKDDRPFTMTVKPERGDGELVLCTHEWLTARVGLDESWGASCEC